MTITVADRILGCLCGIATGDAIGKQTEMLSPSDIEHWYPGSIRGFEGTPGDVILRYATNSKRQWLIGETTDDTERTLAVARAVLADRRVSHVSVGREMLGCTKCVHRGVRSLWEFHQAADPARIATEHDGCGAAIRVAPVGTLYPSEALDALVTGAFEASISTHGGSLALAAAAATASAVSAALDGADRDRVFNRAEEAAGLSERRWPGASAFAFTTALRRVRDDLASLPVLRAADVAARGFPESPLTIVPLALALATLMESSEEAILLAANVGGDSDSVASIAGGILGAMHPDTVNREWRDVVESVNGHSLKAVAGELARLRNQS